MRAFSFTLSLLLLLVLAVTVDAQDAKILKKMKELGIDMNGDNSRAGGAENWEIHKVALSDEENAMVDALLAQMKSDPQTMEMIKKMRDDEGHALDMLIKSTSGPEKVKNLQTVLSEFKALEVLFRDPVKALKVMNEDGMVPPERLPAYQANPRLLEEDTRKGLYFSFVTMTLALGML